MQILGGSFPPRPASHRKGFSNGTGKLLERFQDFCGASSSPRTSPKVGDEGDLCSTWLLLSRPTLHFSSALAPVAAVQSLQIGSQDRNK